MPTKIQSMNGCAPRSGRVNFQISFDSCFHDYQRHIYGIKGQHLAAWTTAILSYYVRECSELVFIYRLLSLEFSVQPIPPSLCCPIN